MSPIEPPDAHCLNAATGWLMLGNAAEARTEFDQISATLRLHPAVLDFEWRLLATERHWLAAAEVGQKLVQVCPDDANAWVHRSYALHELRRTREAFDKLLPAAGHFPQEPIISYNLACYTCQLGDLTAARRWVDRSLALSKKASEKLLRLRSALEDPDLQPLWPELKQRVTALQAELES
jgi:tetratricopeptide (TPR) repeat protein